MKRFSFIVLTTLFVLSLPSCTDDGGCSFTGNWKVKSADLQSSKLSETILQMAKEDMLSTTYAFSKDGNITITGGGGSTVRVGSWTFDKATQEVTWSGKGNTGEEFKEVSKVDACTPSDISLFQRIPSDTTKEEIAKISFILEKVN